MATSEKCFCHFNGYAVKDATARTDLETAKKEIAANAKNITSVQEAAVTLADRISEDENRINACIDNVSAHTQIIGDHETRIKAIEDININSELGVIHTNQASYDSRITALESAGSGGGKLYRHFMSGWFRNSNIFAYFYLIIYRTSETPLYDMTGSTTSKSFTATDDFIVDFLANANVYKIEKSGVLYIPTAPFRDNGTSANYIEIEAIGTIDASTGAYTSNAFNFPYSGLNISEYTVTEV